MAEGISLAGISRAKMVSIERRFARFIANDRVQVSTIWEQVLAQVLAYWKGKQVFLVLDCTPFGDRASIVYLGLLVQSRVLPVAWRIMPLQEEWDQGQWELVGELLDAVRRHLEATDCTVMADRGLAGLPLVNLCRERKFHYLLRVCKEEHTCRRRMGQSWSWWCALQHVIRAKGQQWYGRVLLWQDATIETHLSAVWDEHAREAWFLMSDRPAGRSRVKEYAWRMRVEATFQDSKSRGWNLEASLIEDRERLNRLLLAFFLAMWWVTHLAAACIHHGYRHRGCLGMIDATKASFGSGGCGCWISCVVHALLPRSFVVYRFRKGRPDGASRCASKMCQGESLLHRGALKRGAACSNESISPVSRQR